MVEPVAEELAAFVTSQVVSELGDEVVDEVVGADAAEAVVAVADVVDDEIDFGVSSCPHSAELAPADFAELVERAAVAPAEPAGLAAV